MKILGFGNRKHNEKVPQACYWRKNAIENARYNVCDEDSLRLIEVKVDVFKKETGFFCFVHDEWSVLLSKLTKRVEKSARSLALFNKTGKFDLTYENNFAVNVYII